MRISRTLSTILLLALANSIILAVSAAESYAKPVTGPCDITFTSVTAWDNEVHWDCGSVEASLHRNNKDRLYICINNGYPGYVAYIQFQLTNVGRRSARIEGYSINTPRPDYYEIEVTYLDGKTVLAPGEATTGVLRVELRDMQGPGAANHFKVKIWASSP